ncbi:CoA ester lyase [Aurantimonas sp. Leaf443]|uniref:HpcH/HpaI aldolase/citrate lyase family protein n=1 Tax=Aurantimonas sp. Leaf443 TaxID=1736378 RepID=UPI0006FF328E|nr:CoA ester lyase [Aurantimonas sp. Leaf443]KQT85240.1 hypothetical protein ASG48_08235 [Aurantimonas sp. Leaf443]
MTIEAISAARSFLFVPGDRPERFGKAAASGADQVILDLEDAVAPTAKAGARAAIAAYFEGGGSAMIRTNAPSSADFSADLDLCRAVGAPALVLPKAETPEDLAAVHAALPQAVLCPLVESARGMAGCEALAAGSGVSRLMFGTIDFMLDLAIPADGEALNAFRSRLVLASRLAGIAAPVDGVTVELRDGAVLEAELARSLAFGFSAKLCIHPAQVEAVHRAFAPGERALAWARSVTAAAEGAGGQAFSLEGQMIDAPVVARARRILGLSART